MGNEKYEVLKKSLIVLAVVLVLGGLLAWKHIGPWPASDDRTAASFTSNGGWGAVAPATSTLEKTQTIAENGQVYTNAAYGFSLDYPQGFTATAIAQPDNSTVVLIQNTADKQGLQITISPFAEPITVLSKERIHQDIPDLTINNDIVMSIGRQGIPAYTFESDNVAFAGHSAEVWFIYKGNLYQASTYLASKPLLDSVLSTISFK
jgi:hypothetical protein